MRRLGWMFFALAVVGCGRRDFNDGMVDAAPIPIDAGACTEPPAGCMDPTVYVCGGTCYAFCKQTVIRAAGAAACTDWGGDLAIANSQITNDCATSQLSGTVGWIGLLQKPGSTMFGAGWEWSDGSPFTFTAWKFNQPDDLEGFESGDENCALLHADGTWSDDDCAQPARYVCSRSM